MAETCPGPVVPDCFQESDVNVDCFMPDHLSDDEMHFPDETSFLQDMTDPIPYTGHAPTTTTTSSPDPPSDVSSDGSGCIEMPGSDAGEEDGSPGSRPSGPSRSHAVQVATSGVSVNGSGEEAPDDTVGSSTKQQFVLVRLDEEGRYMRTANDEDMRLLVEMLNDPKTSSRSSAADLMSTISDAAQTSMPPTLSPSPPPPSQSSGQRKPGGPCCHCGAIESPQWRRGPVNKPVLCNACGTRYRRTNQLGVAIPSYLKDKSRGNACVKKRPSREVLEADTVQPPAKHSLRGGSSSRTPSARFSDAISA